MYPQSEGQCEGRITTSTNNPSPLTIAQERKANLEKALQEVERLIELLTKNPAMEELLKLSRRYL